MDARNRMHTPFGSTHADKVLGFIVGIEDAEVLAQAVRAGDGGIVGTRVEVAYRHGRPRQQVRLETRGLSLFNPI